MTDTSESSASAKDLNGEQDRDSLSSQVVDIISGITLGAIQSLDAAVDRAAAMLEEGYDSVFYDEAYQVPLDINTESFGPFGSRESGDLKLVYREASEASITKRDEGDAFTNERVSGLLDKHVTVPVQSTEADPVREQPDPQRCQTEPTTLSKSPVRELKSGESVWSSEEPEANHQTKASIFTQLYAKPEESTSPEQGKRESGSEEKEEVLEPKGGAEAPHQKSGDNLQDSGESQDELVQEQEQNYNSQESSLASGRKSGQTKYNSVSYRKIRRGNTRQKIEEFEAIMNI